MNATLEYIYERKITKAITFVIVRYSTADNVGITQRHLLNCVTSFFKSENPEPSQTYTLMHPQLVARDALSPQQGGKIIYLKCQNPSILNMIFQQSRAEFGANRRQSTAKGVCVCVWKWLCVFDVRIDVARAVCVSVCDISGHIDTFGGLDVM